MFHLQIVTPEKEIFSGDIVMLVAPSVSGEIGILTNHQALVTQLVPGGLRIVQKDENGQESERTLFTSGGYLEVNNNIATVLADVAENIDEIELDQVKEARKKAEEMLKNAKSDVEMERLLEELRVQMIRERFANIRESRKHLG